MTDAPLDATWQADPYFRMDIGHHNGLPPVNITDQLVLQNVEIQRHTFIVEEAGLAAAFLLREVHTPLGGEPSFVDHWAFRANYTPPAEAEPDVVVQTAPVQYATTAKFFQAMKNQAIIKYAMIEYFEEQGSAY